MPDGWKTRLLRAFVMLIVGVGMVSFGACSHEGDAGEDGSGLSANKSDDQVGADGQASQEPDPFDGSYRMVLTSEVTTREPGGFFSGPTETVNTTTFYGVVEILAQGSELDLQIQFCDSQLPEVSGYVPSVAQSTVRGLDPIIVRGERFVTPEVTTFETAESAWVIGASLEDPLTEPLPTSADDARVLDVELDGEPGVTLTLENWDIYGAMRLLFRLQGELESDGVLTGQAEIAMETAVFGDTVPLINVASSLASAREDTTVISESHRFELTRMTRGSLSCEQAFDGAPLDPEEPAPGATMEPVVEREVSGVDVVVGGACTNDEDCVGSGAVCLGAELGFPEGHCSTSCEGICPYQPEGLPAVCSELGDQGAWCFEGCEGPDDLTSCPADFACTRVTLVGMGDTQVYACQPSEGLPQAPEGRHPDAPVEDCIAELMARGIGFELAAAPDESPPGHPELQCTIEDPIMVDGTLAGVNYRYSSPDASVKRIYVSCRLALAMHETALLAHEQGVSDIVHLGAYNCRTISGTSTLSQHGLGNAIDIAGVRLEDGTYWSIFEDWVHDVEDPEEEGAQWLSWFANQLYAQWIFNLILTPNYDANHDDHLHCDLSPDSHEIH